MTQRTISLTLTNAGRTALINASNAGTDVEFTAIALGSGTVALDALAEALTSQQEQAAIFSSTNPAPGQMNISSLFNVDPAAPYNATELALIGDGVVFGVWSTTDPTQALVVRTPGVPYTATIAVGYSQLPSQNVTVVVQPLDDAIAALEASWSASTIDTVFQRMAPIQDTGEVNAYAAANVVPLTAATLKNGRRQRVIIATTNTGPSTYSPDGLAPAPLVGRALLPLQKGEVVATQIAELEYNLSPVVNDGDGAWVVLECIAGTMQTPDAAASQHATSLGQVQTGKLSYAAAAGTGDALLATLPVGMAALTDGFPVHLRLTAANATAKPTLNVSIGTTATGALSIVKGANQPLVPGDLAGAGAVADFAYNQGNNNWVLKNPAGGVSSLVGLQGSVKNFKSTAPGVNSYTTVVTADEVVLENGIGIYLTQRNVNLTLNANGIVGAPLSIMSARAASTWYYRWLWYNATNGLTATFDTSSTAPTAPTGYASTDYKCKLPGASRTDSSASQYLLQIQTLGNQSQYVVTAGSNVATLPTMATSTSTTWPAAVSVSSFVPFNAAHISVVLATLNIYNGEGFIVAPNSAYTLGNALISLTMGNTNGTNLSGMAEMLLESTNVYWGGSSTGSSSLYCLGWRDA